MYYRIFVFPLNFPIQSVPLLFVTQTEGLVTCVFILATYSEGLPTKSATWFCQWLEESTTDFRVHKSLLKGLKYAVFGLGNSLYEGHYNQVE